MGKTKEREGVGRDSENLGRQVTYFSLYCASVSLLPVSLADDKLTVQSDIAGLCLDLGLEN